jgi:hypothetical protein
MPRSDVTIRFSASAPAFAYPEGARILAQSSAPSAAEVSNPVLVNLSGADIGGEAGRVGGLLDLLYPRISMVWQGNAGGFDDTTRTENMLAVAEYCVISPLTSHYAAYRTRIKNNQPRNPTFKAIKYVAPLENTKAGEQEQIDALALMDNPNRGGGDTANDGNARSANGGLVGTGYGGDPTGPGNSGINVTDFVTPYAGTPASSDSDLTKPRSNERPKDYIVRAEYFNEIDSIDDFVRGGFFDITNRYDMYDSPVNGWDFDNSGSDRYTSASVWQNAIARMTYLMFGESLGGSGDTAPTLSGGSPGARPSGQPWYIASSDPLIVYNANDWESDGVTSSNGLTETNAWLNGSDPTPVAAPFVGIGHGGMIEFGFGGPESEGYMGGIAQDGIPNDAAGSFPNSADIVFAMAYLRDRHHVAHPDTGRKMTTVECRAVNYFAASHFFILCCMADVCSNNRDMSGFAVSSQGESFIPFEIDEHVGQDPALLTADQCATKKGWMGAALTPAWPNLIKTDGSVITADGTTNSVLNSGAVWVREFENAIALSIPGRTHYKNVTLGYPNANSSTEEIDVDMTLFPPGSGKKWQRINGNVTNEPWNDGSDVGSLIRLGTPTNNVNRNSIILRRVDI